MRILRMTSCSLPAMDPAKTLTSTAPLERRSQSAATFSRALPQGERSGAMLAILMTILAAGGTSAGEAAALAAGAAGPAAITRAVNSVTAVRWVMGVPVQR